MHIRTTDNVAPPFAEMFAHMRSLGCEVSCARENREYVLAVAVSEHLFILRGPALLKLLHALAQQMAVHLEA